MLAPRSPKLAAAWAEHLFLTARRHKRPEWEIEALRSSQAARVPFEGGFLPTWTWTPKDLHRFDTPRTIVLVHGWEGRGSQLAAFVPPLLELGYRVVTFDAPGHGDNVKPHGSIVDHARALSTLAAHLGPFDGVVGHSVGAAASLLATRLGFDARRFVLLAPPVSPAPFASTFAKTLRLEPSLLAGVLERLELRYGMRFDDLDVREDAARIPAPILVVHDPNDAIVAFGAGAAIVESARSGELVATEGVGHRRILRANQVVDRVVRFFEQTPDETFGETVNGELYMRDKRFVGGA